MALDAKFEIGAGHAVTVVGYADEPAAAAIGEYVNATRAGIERVLDKLFYDARRPLNDFAGGDAVDDSFG
jgi:hypothetical protein